MKWNTSRNRQILVLIVFTVLLSIAGIIHGIFFDLDFEQIKRLSLEGTVLTFLVIFPAVLFLEWLFDMNNKDKFEHLEQEIAKLKKK